MEKSSKKKVNKKDEKDEVIKKDDIYKMYEVIKSKDLLKDLCHDALSDLNKKPSYIRLKDMIDQVIKNSVESYTYESRPNQEHLQTRTLFTRLSILTYTIDSIISGLLYKKLNEEIKQIILTEINKAKQNNKGHVGESSCVNMTENVDIQSNKEEYVNPIDDAKQKQKSNAVNQKGSKTVDLLPEKEGSPDAGNQKGIKISKIASVVSEKEKSLDVGNQKGIKISKTSSIVSEIEESLDTGNQKVNKSSKRADIVSRTEKSLDAGNQKDIRSSKTAGVVSQTEKSLDAGNQKGMKSSKTAGLISEAERPLCAGNNKRIKSSKTTCLVSDAELSDFDIASDDDIDGFSLHGSEVSSVHTSDLSSFEDDISISSEDEAGGKTIKHIPLKLARNLYDAGELSDLLPVAKKKTKSSSSTSSSSKSSKTDSPKSSKFDSPKSSKYDDAPTKRLPTRVRKPNSKYSSDDVICPIKNILSHAVPTNSHRMETDYLKDSQNDHQKEKTHKLSHKVSKILQNSPSKSDRIGTNILNSPINHVGGIISNHSSPKGKKSKTLKTNFSEAQNKTTIRVSEIKPKSLTGEEEKRKQGQLINKMETNILISKESSTTAVPQSEKRYPETKLSESAKRRKIEFEKTDSEKTPNFIPNLLQITHQYLDRCSFNRKKVPSSSMTTDQTSKEQIKHSIESFSEFEESLCVKEKKIDSPKSSKSSTKSYDKSDLYKPHNDFRLSFNSRGSKATTMFSN